MGRFQLRRTFKEDSPLYVRRQLEAAGIQFNMGELLPWKELEVELGMVKRWFRLRLVGHELIEGGPPREEPQARKPPRDSHGLRTDGPTIEEFVAAGYLPEHYEDGNILQDYATKPSPGLSSYRRDKTGPWLEEQMEERRARITVKPVPEPDPVLTPAVAKSARGKSRTK